MLSYFLPIDPFFPLIHSNFQGIHILLCLAWRIYCFTSRGSLHTDYPLWSFLASPIKYICVHLYSCPPYSAFDNLCLTLPLLKTSKVFALVAPVCFLSPDVSCWRCSLASHSFCFIIEHAKNACRQTRPSTTVRLSSSHLPRNPHSCHLCLLVCIHSLLTLAASTASSSCSQPRSPPQLLSCSFIPRGEEQTPIITQVSVKWIIGRLIELLDGKHPSWVVRLSVLSLLPHLPAARAQGLHVHIQRLCWERRGVVFGGCEL